MIRSSSNSNHMISNYMVSTTTRLVIFNTHSPHLKNRIVLIAGSSERISAAHSNIQNSWQRTKNKRAVVQIRHETILATLRSKILGRTLEPNEAAIFARIFMIPFLLDGPEGNVSAMHLRSLSNNMAFSRRFHPGIRLTRVSRIGS